MDPTQDSFFDMAERRLKWTDQRASLLAQNIANADTPGWRSRDLKPFSAALAQTGVGLAVTDPMHLSGSHGTQAGVVVAGGERAPNGNAVAIDKELVKVAATDTSHALVTDLYKKYMGLYRTALGK